MKKNVMAKDHKATSRAVNHSTNKLSKTGQMREMKRGIENKEICAYILLQSTKTHGAYTQIILI